MSSPVARTSKPAARSRPVREGGDKTRPSIPGPVFAFPDPAVRSVARWHTQGSRIMQTAHLPIVDLRAAGPQWRYFEEPGCTPRYGRSHCVPILPGRLFGVVSSHELPRSFSSNEPCASGIHAWSARPSWRLVEQVLRVANSWMTDRLQSEGRRPRVKTLNCGPGPPRES